MSIRIDLRFDLQMSTRLLAMGIAVRIIRLMARVRFWGKTGWMPYRWAILDTGSPVSLIPRSLAQVIEAGWMTPALPLRGIAPQRTATVRGQLAEVTMQLLDSRNTTSPLPLRAYLLSTDRVPLVIGMEDVLTECQLCSDFPHNIAYLEFP